MLYFAEEKGLLMRRNMIVKTLAAAVAACGVTACGGKGEQTAEDEMQSDTLWLVVGSYASATDEGIKVYAFDQRTAEATPVSALAGISNPSYLTVVEKDDAVTLFSVSEGGEEGSSVHSIAFDRTDGAMMLADAVATHGAAPCYITSSPDRRWVVTANYNGANVSVAAVDSMGCFVGDAATYAFEGSGPVADRQSQPHLHCVEFMPDGRRLLATDLGMDCIHVFAVNDTASLASDYLRHEGDVSVEPGSGPRHIVFDRSAAHAYLINEISGRVTVFDASQEMNIRQYAVSDSVGAQGSGDIHLSADGRFLYTSNRLQADGIAIFSVGDDGLLERVGYQATGRHPRNFVVTPNDRYLLVACRDDNVIEIYVRDLATGLLEFTGKTIETSAPVCLKFVEKR